MHGDERGDAEAGDDGEEDGRDEAAADGLSGTHGAVAGGACSFAIVLIEERLGGGEELGFGEAFDTHRSMLRFGGEERCKRRVEKVLKRKCTVAGIEFRWLSYGEESVKVWALVWGISDDGNGHLSPSKQKRLGVESQPKEEA